MYQALYRKWRPLRFADVAGQGHITETLRRQVESGRSSHAYLFTGTRGTGKTTCAKILSRAVNCENPQNGDPCNMCRSCQDILSGANLDVIEIDAASNSGVDNIRSLRDESVYAPVSVKKRVYIIDEVHMLSIGAFNALLKTLEEPPEHVLFILATTETHKVPATILSRCQRFAFRRIGREDITDRLILVAENESIELTREAAVLLAGLSDGAMRDALSLLDQCAGTASGHVDAQTVYAAVGMAGHVEVIKWVRDIAQRKTELVLKRFDRMLGDGRDVTAMLDELSTAFRDVLMAHTMSKAPSMGAVALDEQSMKGLMAMLTPGRLLVSLSLLQEAQGRLPTVVSRRIAAEMCLIRLCDEALTDGLAGLEARVRRLEENGVPQGKPNIHVAENVAPVAVPPVPEAKSEPYSSRSANVGTPSFWPPLLLSMMRVAPSALPALQNASPSLKGNKLIISVKSEWEAAMLRRPEVLAGLRQELRTLENQDFALEIQVAKEENRYG